MLTSFARRDALRWACAAALGLGRSGAADRRQDAILRNYDETTAGLSEPVDTRWKNFAAVYFRTNDKLLNRFYPRFDGAGGVVVGVSFQQNFCLLAHARPELSVIFDINPAVTEILIPFVGGLMTMAPTRRQFISRLLGVGASAADTERLLQGASGPESPPGAVYADLVRKTAPGRREELLRSFKDELERTLARLSISPYQRSEVMKWPKILEDEEYLTGDFFMDSVLPYTMSANPKEQKTMAGWLSTEENYRLVRRYWMEGKIIGVTGDIGGPSVTKLAARLRKTGKQVSLIYLSDVGTAMTGPGTPAHFLRLYEALGQLPLQRQTQVLISHGSMLTAYNRTYVDALWLYRYLADVDYSTFFRLNANVLQSVTQEGAGAVLPSFRREFQKLVEDKIRKNDPITEATISLYSLLLDRLEVSAETLKTLDLPGFTEWIKNDFGELDTAGAIFRTTAATLKEVGALKRS